MPNFTCGATQGSETRGKEQGASGAAWVGRRRLLLEVGGLWESYAGWTMPTRSA